LSELQCWYCINFREKRRINQEGTIQRHWQHWAHKIQNEDKQNTTQHRKLKDAPPPQTPLKQGMNPGARKIKINYF